MNKDINTLLGFDRIANKINEELDHKLRSFIYCLCPHCKEIQPISVMRLTVEPPMTGEIQQNKDGSQYTIIKQNWDLMCLDCMMVVK